MREVINFCFKGWERQFNALTKSGATWTDNKNKLIITFDKVSLKLVINFPLNNCFFFNFGNLSFRQIYFHIIVKQWLFDTKKNIYVMYSFLVICFI